MELEFFAYALLIVSTLTGLIVEALKALCKEYDTRMEHPNTTAGVVAVVVSFVLGCVWGYVTHAPVTPELVISIAALAVLSWLCAMLGYDKVVQTLAQLRR